MTTETIAEAIHAAGQQREIAPPSHRLTPREKTLLRVVADGNTNRSIARQLDMTERSAGVAISRLLNKLDARDRANAVHIGWQIGVLP